MLDVLYRTFSLFCNDSKFFEKIKFNSIFRHAIAIIANILVPLWYKLTWCNPKYVVKHCAKSEGRIIASMTTFPRRISKVWIVVESILRQKRKPDMLILWLSKEQFPSIDNLPIELKKQQNRGLQIRLCEGDLRSHKKYYYVLCDYPRDNLFTFDDDIIYPSNTISSVLDAAKSFPKCVIGRFSNQIKLDDENNVCFTKNKCDSSFVLQPSWSTFIGSGGGALYPAGSLPEIAKEKDIFMTICKTADDVWLNSMCRYSGHKVVTVMKRCPLLEIINRNNTTLYSINAGEENYKQQKAVRKFCIANGNDPFQLLAKKHFENEINK